MTQAASTLQLACMDIAGFAGFAERGPLPPLVTDANFDPSNVAIRLTGWDDYRTTFGGFGAYGYLPYAVRAFFENGGTECYVVRVAATTVTDPALQPRAALFPVPGAAHATAITLAAAVAAGDDTVKIVPAGAAGGADLLAFTGQGLEEYVPVSWADGAGTLHLALPLQAAYPAGSAVTKYDRAFLVTAASAGNWGNRISLQFTPLAYTAQVSSFALRVKVAPGVDLTAPEEEEYYPLLSLDPASAAYAPTLVNAASALIRIDTSGTMPGLGLLTTGPAGGRIALSGGRDGLSAVNTREYVGGAADFRGLAVFERVDQVGILCAPDAVWPGPPPALPQPPPPPTDPCAKPTAAAAATAPPIPDPTAIPPASDPATIYQQMIAQCGIMRYRTAILDLPLNTPPRQAATWAGDQQLISDLAKFAAVYYPWIKMPDPLSPYQVTRVIPACGHAAGTYASTDHNEGVQKPPANLELSLAVDTSLAIDDLAQGPLNQAGVNVIRVIPGRGIRVWGARSLAVLDLNQQDWMYIHVRRLMSAIEATVERSSRWAVFRPNDRALRSTLTHALNVLLESIRQSGGLQGSTPEQAYFVKCDATNNPREIIDAGQLVCQIGVAVADAAEFLVFELRQDVSGSNMVEA